MRYKVGDKVKLRNDLIVDKDYGNIRFLNGMKNFLNKELTIENIDYAINTFESKESCYTFSFEMIREYTWEDFLKAPIGTKVTFERGSDLIKYSVEGFKNKYGSVCEICDLKYFEGGSLGKIVKIEEPTYTTVYELTEQVEEMTMEEVCKALGKNIKIVKEK